MNTLFGKKVRMTEKFKNLLKTSESKEHVEEFGNCVGTVEGLVDYGDCKGPEVDVRWEPSKLRYGYDPYDLEIVE